jgi:hypothetical protein
MGVDRAVVVADDDRFAGLVRGNDEADSEPVEKSGKIRGVYAAQGSVGR